MLKQKAGESPTACDLPQECPTKLSRQHKQAALSAGRPYGTSSEVQSECGAAGGRGGGA